MVERTTPASLNFLCATTDLTPEDCKPIKFSETQSRPRSRPVQRTVFQIGSEWDSAATEAVLDAFHLSVPAEIGQDSPVQKSLKFSRASGSVEVDAEMADIFAEPTSHSCLDKAALHKSTMLPLVQCCICHRPVLFTRAVSHMKSCRTPSDTSRFIQDHMPPTPTVINDEEKMNLICAPYSDSKQEAKAKDGSQSSATPSARGSTNHRDKESVRASLKLRKASFPKDEDDWETSLTPIVEVMPRSSTYRRRRILIPPTPDTPRKRLQSDKKAISAASLAGLYPSTSSKQSVGIASKPPDPLREIARKWSARTPWAKLMHMALPLRAKLTPKKRKFSLAIGTVSVDADESSSHATNINGNIKNTKQNDSLDRYYSGGQQQPPSLIGALLWLRGHAIREIFATPVQHMDIPSSLHARIPTLFHGQTLSSRVSTFETDPRPISTIKLPASITRKSKISAVGVPASKAPSVDKKQRTIPPKAASAQANGTMPPPKKPKVPKPQPILGNGHAFSTITPQQVQAAARNNANRSGARAQPPLNPSHITPELQRHMLQQRHISKVAAKTAINGAVGSAAIAASSYANIHQPSQRNMYLNALPATIAGMHARTGASAGHPSAHLPATMNANPNQGTKSTGSRGSKGRVPVGHQATGASPGMRVTGAVPIRNQSPSQGSSRSADRSSRMRIPAEIAAAAAARQYDAGLLASAAQQLQRGHVPHPMYSNQTPIDFPHMLAQIAGTNNHHVRDDLSALGNGVHPGVTTDVADVVRRNIQGMSPLAGVKPGGSVQGTPQVPQLRDPSLLKPNATPRMGVQKNDQNIAHRSKELEQQLRQGAGFMLDNSSAAAKLEAAWSGYGKRPSPQQIGVPNMSQGLYDAALAAVASPQMGPNAIAMKNQAFLRMAPNSLGAAPTNPSVLQNMRDMSNLAGLPLVVGMPGQTHGNNVMNFMPTTAPTSGLQNPALSNPMAPTVTGKGVGQGQSMNLLSSNPILQQMFGAKALGTNINNAAHPQQFVEANAQLSNLIPGMRPVGVPPTGQDLAPGDKASFLNEIDKVFEGKD